MLENVLRLNRDLANAAKTMSDNEARYFVDAYYIQQDNRQRSNNQVRALGENSEPNSVIVWLADQATTLENQIKRALDKYTGEHLMGSWMRGIYGIGPVLSAGLLAHIDIKRAETVGHIWSYAGLNPEGRKPAKGTTWPYNSHLKSLCWKIGQSFMKFSNVDECFYGKVYRERKAYEIARNESGGNAATAARILTEKNWTKGTDAYKAYSSGILPPAQIDARARRYAVKLFLSHLHGEWYRREFGKEPPLPYPIAHLNHVHFIEAPL